ncbi:hypothetical protein [Winogradskya consettensis]|uniref:hypothetical protein n=1 Tax=Winogradskya consettensis TaxID=113560 RepID=UPI001BB447C4|nr:hypothetical protein [Actinoplanes consettensis]
MVTLQHVYWIGGGSGAGKSTIARRIAHSLGLRLYATDDVMTDHAARSSPIEAPLLHDFMAMDMDDRWLNRSPEVMLTTFHWYRGEAFPLITEDLGALPPHPPLLAEGFRLLPHLVEPLLPAPHHAVWLLPTPAFRRAAFTSRGSTWQIAGRTSNPAKALENLLTRDRLFTDQLRTEARRLNLRVIEVDPALRENDLLALVTDALGLDRVAPSPH